MRLRRRKTPSLQRVDRALAAGVGTYWIATGVWPLVSRRAFEAVTGPKRDFWLAQSVGVAVTGIGIGLALGARSGTPPVEVRVASALTALGLAGIETYQVARRRIRPVYAADAVLEAAFGLWTLERLGGASLRRRL